MHGFESRLPSKLEDNQHLLDHIQFSIEPRGSECDDAMQVAKALCGHAHHSDKKHFILVPALLAAIHGITLSALLSMSPKCIHMCSQGRKEMQSRILPE